MLKIISPVGGVIVRPVTSLRLTPRPENVAPLQIAQSGLQPALCGATVRRAAEEEKEVLTGKKVLPLKVKTHFPTVTLLSGGRKAGGGRRGGNQIQKKVILKPFTFRLSASIMQGKGRSRGGAAGGGRSRGAGGPGGGGGNCPAPSVTQCAGQVSNCWSVGEPDVDCPNLGLCCFNGCANVCQSQGR